ncbi:hypothetical protein J7U46_22540, partial [Pelomonas sp. V22]|uniref:hypothetical protein n=1 Tax=Pelomonas sp. V22 TaxID=2822139 RepID=UPI0024A9CDCF
FMSVILLVDGLHYLYAGTARRGQVNSTPSSGILLDHALEGGTHKVLQGLFDQRTDAPSLELGEPEVGWTESGLTYEQIATTALAESVETAYEFAYFGHLNTDVSDWDSESTPAWITRVLVDLGNSEFVAEWEEYSKCKESIRRCQQVFEAAQARLVLEGLEAEGDRFMDWHGPNTPGLSFRQMSLLSGMTEASLRTLAGGKRQNPLVTRTEGRNAFITPDDAKAWLISKGRYVPIKHTSRHGRHDPTTHRFQSADELIVSLNQRLRFLLSEPHAVALSVALQAIGISVVSGQPGGLGPHLDIPESALDDANLMSRLGTVLALPGELLALRAAEVRAVERLRAIERQIKALDASTAK